MIRQLVIDDALDSRPRADEDGSPQPHPSFRPRKPGVDHLVAPARVVDVGDEAGTVEDLKSKRGGGGKEKK